MNGRLTLIALALISFLVAHPAFADGYDQSSTQDTPALSLDTQVGTQGGPSFTQDSQPYSNNPLQSNQSNGINSQTYTQSSSSQKTLSSQPVEQDCESRSSFFLFHVMYQSLCPANPKLEDAFAKFEADFDMHCASPAMKQEIETKSNETREFLKTNAAKDNPALKDLCSKVMD